MPWMPWSAWVVFCDIEEDFWKRYDRQETRLYRYAIWMCNQACKLVLKMTSAVGATAANARSSLSDLRSLGRRIGWLEA